MREQTLARQKKLGIVPEDTEVPPINPIGTYETRTGPDGMPFPVLDETRPWVSLSDDEKRLFSRMAEVFPFLFLHQGTVPSSSALSPLPDLFVNVAGWCGSQSEGRRSEARDPLAFDLLADPPVRVVVLLQIPEWSARAGQVVEIAAADCLLDGHLDVLGALLHHRLAGGVRLLLRLRRAFPGDTGHRNR